MRVVKRPCRFTFRERQVIWGKAAGLRDRQIAEAIGCAVNTVHVYMRQVTAKLGCCCPSWSGRRAILRYLHER